MKKQFVTKLILLLGTLFWSAGQVSAEKVKWIKTLPKDIQTGDSVVIVDMTSATAMSNNPEADKSPSATSVTFNDGKDQLSGDVADNLKWLVTIPADGQYQFGTGGNFLYATDDDSGLRVGTDANNKFDLVKDDANNKADFLHIKTGDNNRFVGVKSMLSIINNWNTKTTIDDDIKGTVITFFKRIISNKGDISLKFEQENYDADLSEAFESPVAIVSPSVTLTYSSSNPWAASVDANTGEVTLKKCGTAVITVSFAGDDDYEAATATYTLRIGDREGDGGMSTPFTVAEAINYVNNGMAPSGTNYFVKGVISAVGSSSAISFSIPGLSTGDEGTVTYSISDNGSTANQMQVTSGRGLNNADLTADDLCIGDTVIVVGSLGMPSSMFSMGSSTPQVNAKNFMSYHKRVFYVKDREFYVGNEIPTDELYMLTPDFTGTIGTPVITLSNSTTCSLDADKLKCLAEGIDSVTVEIPVVEDGATLYSFKKTFVVTVKTGHDPEGLNSGSYELVTDVSTLKDGDKIVIIAKESDKDYAMGTEDGLMGGKGAKEAKLTDGSLTTVPDGAAVITLKKLDDKWALNLDGTKYFYTSGNKPASDGDSGTTFDLSSLLGGSSNKLRTGDVPGAIGDSAKVAITIDADGFATIKFSGDSVLAIANPLGSLLGGSGSGSGGSTGSSFSFSMASFDVQETVTSTDSLPRIYRFTECDDYDITIDETGWFPMVSSKHVSLPQGLKAYVVKTVDGDMAMLDDVTSLNIKANTPYLLKGEPGTYKMTKIEESAVQTPAVNLMKVSDTTTANGIYAFDEKMSHGAGFYKWDNSTLGAGRIYMDGSVAASDVQFISLVIHIHDYSSEWSTDATSHWHACTSTIGECDAQRIDEGEHVYGDTGEARYTCQVCQYVDYVQRGIVIHSDNMAAAQRVIDLINAIGYVEYTPECEARIDVAHKAFYALTEPQMKLVTNFDVLLNAIRVYAELEAAYKAALKNLGNLIAEAAEYHDSIQSDYEDVAATLQEAIDAAQTVLDNPAFDTDKLNAASKALKSVLEAAKEMVAARQNLADLIDEATEYHDSIQSKFEDLAATLQKAIDAAQDVLDNPDSTVDELNDAADALQAALDAADMVVTRIAAIKADDEDAVWFDMNGRRLPTKPQTKGMYIRNGKTVIVK